MIRTAQTIIVAVVLGLLLGGCSVAGPGTASPTAPASPTATAADSTTPTTSTSASPSLPIPPTDSLEPPPDASLAAEGGDPVTGTLGSWTWAGGGSDSPWLSGAPIRLGAREPLAVRLAADEASTSWTAVRAPASAGNGVGATTLAEGTTAIRFEAPPPGAWTIALTVRFARGGSAVYYWLATVVG